MNGQNWGKMMAIYFFGSSNKRSSSKGSAKQCLLAGILVLILGGSGAFLEQVQAFVPLSTTLAVSAASRADQDQPIPAEKLILNDPVIDEAKVLTPAQKQQLSDRLKTLYQQGLAQAAIVIVPSTHGEPIFDYALKIAEKWQLGNKDTDDGLLIVVAIQDRNLYILTGYGLEGVIPDAVASRIIRETITPHFKKRDYAGGLLAGVDRIEARLTADPETLAKADAQAKKNQADNTPSPMVLLITFFVLGLVATTIFGRFLGSSIAALGLFGVSFATGAGFFISLVIAVILWLFLLTRNESNTGGGSGFGGGGFSSGGFGGGFGGSGGGYGGGGGGFGGGGAGGSW